MQKIWNTPEPNRDLSLKLSRELGISGLFAQILINRGLASSNQIQDFINSDLSLLYDPFKLPDMHLAVERIKKAITHKEKVLIFGDYDVDGLTSVAILKTALHKLGLKTLHYLPHRLKEGYGLNQEAVKFARNNKVSLFICVDCGTTSFTEIESLNKNKIDTIIIDHHHPQDEKLPAALAIINPKRQDCDYPYFDLAAVGLVFKFVQALLEKIPEEDLDLVCLGTVSDVAPLDGENRILVKHGLETINQTKKPGLRALMEVAGILGKPMSTGYINYILGPRINASGRMDTAETSLKLLLSQSELEAGNLARDLNRHNQMRQQIEGEILEEALTKIEREINFKDHFIIVLSKEGWHQGVLGIVASKISERFTRPAIIISLDGSVGKGSARSIKNFHILEALANCREFLTGFGGHRYAAGLTITKERINDFIFSINEFARKNFTPQDFYPAVEIDTSVSFSQLNKDLISEIESLAPFGAGNSRPIFSSHNLKIKDKPAVLGRDTLKFWVTDGEFTYPAVGFGMADMADSLSAARTIALAFKISLDKWQGAGQLQLEIEDIKFDTGD